MDKYTQAENTIIQFEKGQITYQEAWNLISQILKSDISLYFYHLELFSSKHLLTPK
jgi:hypothetical protein